jgi:hypothetical protein
VTDPRNPVYVFRSEHWREWNYGLSAGGGLEVRAGRTRILAEVVYDRGLADVYGGTNIDLHTSGLRLGLGLAFTLGREAAPAASLTPGAAR